MYTWCVWAPGRRGDRRCRRSPGTAGHVRLLHHVAGAAHPRPPVVFLHADLMQAYGEQALQLWRNSPCFSTASILGYVVKM